MSGSAAPDATGDTSLPEPRSSSAYLARSAGVVSAATMASRLLGLLRDQVLLWSFGVSDNMDAYKVAFRLPNLIRDLFAEGAMSAAFVPTFTRELQQRGKEAAWDLGRIVISGLMAATGLIAIVAILVADRLTGWVAAGFAEVPGKLELTTRLTQVMFPFLVLIAVAVACMGMLNARRWFFVPALAPAVFNVATIASVFVVVPLMPWFGWHPMVGLAIGTLLGGLGQIAIQWPALRREGFRFRFKLAPRDPRFREILRLMVPATLGLAAVQINQLVNVALATGEGTGAVTSLDFAFRVMYLPIGLFGVSIATAALPGISRLATANEPAGVRMAVSQALRLMLVLNVPATLGLVALSVPIIELLVEYKEVTAADTAAIATALVCYAPGLVGYSAVKILSPTFYAFRDARTPVTISLVSIGLNIVLNLALVRVMSFPGLALGTSIAALVNAAALFVLLRRKLRGLDDRNLLVASMKILVAGLVMAAVAWGTEEWLSGMWAANHAGARVVRVTAAVTAGLATLAIVAKLLRLHEFDAAFGRVLSRLRGTGSGAGQPGTDR